MTNDLTHGRDDERPHTEGAGSGVPDPDGLEGREREGSAATPDGLEARERRAEESIEDHLETRVPLEPGTGPRSPRGDALLEGTGTRHGVDAPDERPEHG